MKKFFKSFFACLIILIIFGGFVFFLGWTQFKIPVNGIGILVSKTGGVREEPIEAGVFSWHWEFLIPSNAELQTYKLKPYQLKKTITGILPGGDVYKNVNKDSLDFSYNFQYELTLSVDKEGLISLIKQSKVYNQESLEAYFNDFMDNLCSQTTFAFLKAVESNYMIQPEAYKTEELLGLTDIKEKNPELNIDNFRVKKAYFPDFQLYIKIRERYLSELSIKNEETKQIQVESSFSNQEKQIIEKEEVNKQELNDELTDEETVNKFREFLHTLKKQNKE